MTVRTPVHEALDRVESECDRATKERSALGRFDATVREMDPVSPAPTGTTTSPAGVTDGGTVSIPGAAAESGARSGGTTRVREVFAETVAPHTTAGLDGDSVDAAVRSSLGDSVALALAPGTPDRLTRDLQQAIRSAVADRREKLRTMETALDRERRSLRAAREEIDAVVEWIACADETPLLRLDFDALSDRHDAIDRHCERCEHVAAERQRLIASTTSHDGSVGITHRSLLEHLYADFESSHPVLATIARLVDRCRDCQRAVRDHLTRRV
ncbi:hypothetical protein ACFQAS_10320 [Halopenitus salinus]|uniref:DUF7260 domain-containing protein n=1 Tax=Halopenitus salinus TaxID=1198295 RepID=A0ABD5UTC5_9EURY